LNQDCETYEEDFKPYTQDYDSNDSKPFDEDLYQS
jgi:hypothetical protein